MVILRAPTAAKTAFDYVAFVVFGEWLGCDFDIQYTEQDNVQLQLRDDPVTKIEIDASFLKSLDSNCRSNCVVEDIPRKLSLECCFLNKDEYELVEGLPVLFGNPECYSGEDGLKIGFDLFGTIFFMLSRYEELNNPTPDAHDRFTAKSSIAYKYGFLDRPIVDEYVGLLWSCMQRLWPALERKKREPKTFISCDVDTPFDPSVRNAYWLARTCFADIAKRNSVAEAYKRVRRYFYNKKGDYRFDPNYTFDWYMDVCEQAGVKAAFYFIPTSVEPHNGVYELAEPAIRDLLIKIDKRGHEIGVHGSYQTFRDGGKLSEQKQLVDNTLRELGIKQEVKGNRQHYLRWDSSITPDLLDEAGFEYDTTGGYADHAGFRFGTCHEFSMWSWQKHAKLKLKQRPLIVMECTVIDDCYMGLGLGEEARVYMGQLQKACHEVGGSFSLLWHNSSFSLPDCQKLFTGAIQC